MKPLKEYLNASYLSAAQGLKPHASRRKIVAYVESFDDILFWRGVLNSFESERFYFEVMLPSRQNLSKGKKVVLMNELGSRLGDSMIACVDADYDYLLQGVTPASDAVCHNPYVFHTYVYAIESYQCYAPTLREVCVMATLNDRELVDFEAFMTTFSQIIHPLLVWNVWAYRYGRYREFSLSDFADVLAIDHLDMNHLDELLATLRHRVNKKINWLQHHFPEGRQTLAPERQRLRDLGLTPDNAYLYIQGHTLFDSVVSPLLEFVCKQLRGEREREIRHLAMHHIQMDNELASYQHSQSDVSTMLRKHTFFRKAPEYQRMISDVKNFLERLDTPSESAR